MFHNHHGWFCQLPSVLFLHPQHPQVLRCCSSSKNIVPQRSHKFCIGYRLPNHLTINCNLILVENLYSVHYKSSVFSKAWEVLGLGPNRHTWSFLNLAPEAPRPQRCGVHHWARVLILASQQHSSEEAPQLLPKHRRRRCRARLTLPALNVKLCGEHVKLNGQVL